MLEFKLTNTNGSLPEIKDKKKFTAFHLQKLAKKRKKQMNEPIETSIVRGQQKFDLYDILNLVKIDINNDRTLNTLKNIKMSTIS